MVKQITPIKDLLSGALNLTIHFFSCAARNEKGCLYSHSISQFCYITLLLTQICPKVPGTEVIKLFSCSTHTNMRFPLLKKLKCSKINSFLAIKLLDVLFILIINVQMPTIVGIYIYMSKINFMLS